MYSYVTSYASKTRTWLFPFCHKRFKYLFVLFSALARTIYCTQKHKKPVNCTHKNASNMIVQIIASKSQLSCAVVEQIGMSTTFATFY